VPRIIDSPAASRRRRVALSLAVTAALAVVAAACGQDAAESAADRGSGLYRANCAACHGDALDGTSRGPSLLQGARATVSDAAMAEAIRNGVEDSGGEFDGMPGNGALRARQIEEIVAYVRDRQRAAAGG
jgi:mono/diheme cytochrome c family protein